VISLLCVIYGCGGIVGSLITGSLFKRGVIGSFAGAATVVAAWLIGLAIVGTLPWLADLLLVLWGLFWGDREPGNARLDTRRRPGNPGGYRRKM
jgi:predicted MFS family arabinose efflux permease